MTEENRTPEPQTPLSTPAPAKAQSSLGVPIAIVVAGLLIALAIFFGGKQAPGSNTQVANDRDIEQDTPELNVAPVTADDHILGNPDAEIVIVEYSDYDCPFCKNFHNTMNQIMGEYGPEGKVAWVYRHFPIKQLHPNAEKTAEASECVADLGGNDAFWKFSNLIFDERGTNEPTDVSQLPNYAEQAGVSRSAYAACLDEGKFAQKIQDDIQAAVDAGARGTPYSILVAGGKQGVINGAQPYNTVKQMIEGVLAELEG